MPSSVSSVVFTIYDPEENTIQSLRAVGGPLLEELGGTSRSDLSGLFSSVGNVPVTYDSANKRFLVQEVTGVSAEVTFDSVSAAIASGSGEIVFNGDFKTTGGGRFVGNVSGNLSGNANTASLATLAISATSALSATNAEIIRNVKFNGVPYNLSSDVDVAVTAGTAVVDFTSVSSALFSATGPISLNNQNFNNVGSFRANNLSGDSVSSNTYRGNTIQVETASATTSFSGPAATISNFTGIIGRFLTSVSSPNVSADDAKFNNSVSANSLSGLIGRFLTSLSAASVSGTSVNAGTLSATGNTTLGAMTGTTGKFTSEVSSPLTIGSTVSATNIASEGNITSQVGTIQGPVGRFTSNLSATDISGLIGRFITSLSSASFTGTSVNAGTLDATGNTTLAAMSGTTGRFTSNLSATDISGLIGRFLTSLSAASVTGTNIVATNATATNFTGTAINTGSLAATSNLSVIGNINTSGDITATGSGKTIKGETVSSTNSYVNVAEAATVIVTNGLTSPSLSATDLKGISVSSQTTLYATDTISNSLSSTNLSSNDARFTNSASANNLSALIGRFLTSVSAASVTGTTLAGTTGNITTVNATNATALNFTATNATATNFTGTTVNAGTVTATGDISTNTGTITAANIRGTLSVSSQSVSGTSVNAGTLAATGNSNLAAVTATGATINGNLATTGNLTTTGTFNVTGDSTLGGNLFLTDASKQIRNQGTISNTGAATFGGDVTVSNNGATFKVGSSAGSGITKLIGTLSAVAIANESITVGQLIPRILFNSTSLSLRSSGSPSINTCQANQNIEIGTNGVINNVILGNATATSSISLDSSGSIFLDTPNGNTSGQSARFTSGVFTTVSATTYLNVPGGGGGDANATSITGRPFNFDETDLTSLQIPVIIKYNTTLDEWQAAVLVQDFGAFAGPVESLVTFNSNTDSSSTPLFTVVSGIKIPSGTILSNGQMLVASGSSVTLVASQPPVGVIPVGNVGSYTPEAIPSLGSILFYDADASPARLQHTTGIKVMSEIGPLLLSGTAAMHVSGGAYVRVDGNLSATTVSATTYLNVRPYVSAVDSATTTTVNINGDYDTYLVNTTTTGVTLYLPDASAYNNKKITISKIDDGGSYRSVTLSGAQLQTATNTVLLYDPTESVTVISNGTNWYSMDYDRAYGVVIVCKNSTGATLAKGTPVKVTGATGANVLIGPVSAANDHVPEAPNGDLSRCIGVVEHDIPTGEFGHVLTKGTLYKFNTNAYNEGDILYLAPSGGFTNVKPAAPYDEVFLGIVTRKQSVNGSILIDVANPIHINDIVGFNLASGLINGDLISYDTTTSTFVNSQAVNVSGQGKFGSVSATNISGTTITATNYNGLPASFDATSIVGLNINLGLGVGNDGDIFYWDGPGNQFSTIGSGVLLSGASVASAILAGSATSAVNAQQAPNGFNVTGTVLATTVSATTLSATTISTPKYPTYIYTATGISVGTNKLMFDMFNGAGSGKTLKVTRIVAYVRNTTTITGINQVLECYRTSSVGTGGTTVTEAKMVTTDPALNANITA